MNAPTFAAQLAQELTAITGETWQIDRHFAHADDQTAAICRADRKSHAEYVVMRNIPTYRARSIRWEFTASNRPEKTSNRQYSQRKTFEATFAQTRLIGDVAKEINRRLIAPWLAWRTEQEELYQRDIAERDARRERAIETARRIGGSIHDKDSRDEPRYQSFGVYKQLAGGWITISEHHEGSRIEAYAVPAELAAAIVDLIEEHTR